MDAYSVVARLAGGDFIERLAFALTEVSERVVVTGNKGRVSVSFEVSKFQLDEPTVLIEEKIATMPPASSAKGAIFFAVGSGALEKDDPRRPELPGFRAVDMTRPDARVIANVEVGS